MLQRSKSLAHVVEFTERRLELVSIRGIGHSVLRFALAAPAHVHDKQNGQDAENNEGGSDHETATLKKRCSEAGLVRSSS